MFLKKVEIDNYKVLGNVSMNFEKKENHNVFPIISANGGGKSTLLQFIFCFLHCAFKEKRQEYLKVLLDYYAPIKGKNDINRLVNFELEYKGENIELAFFLCKNDYKKLNFNSIIALKEVKNKRQIINQSINQIDLLNKLEKDLQVGKISPHMVWRELRDFIKNSKEEEDVRRGDVKYSLQFISSKKKEIESLLISDEDLDRLEIKAEADKNNFANALDKENLKYAFHLSKNKEVLLYKTNTNSEILQEIADKIYLAVPTTQVLHFLKSEQIQSLFSTRERYIYTSYEHHLKECQSSMTGLFTYEFSTINLIIDAYQNARDKDFKQVLKTGKYGNQVAETQIELSNILSNKSITIDDELKGVTFTSTKSKLPLSPKDLSHGELKKLAIYIWLKAKTTENSLILMDEVDMGLHPNWQHDIYNDLQKWSEGSQFLLATHSPQIISKAFYKNLVVITPTETGATAEQFNEAPIESDLNTVVKTIMGGEYVPKELLDLRAAYRNLFDNNKIETKEAMDIKDKMLAYESENSSFFQGLKFEMQFR